MGLAPLFWSGASVANQANAWLAIFQDQKIAACGSSYGGNAETPFRRRRWQWSFAFKGA
jgi:hypothetical protein